MAETGQRAARGALVLGAGQLCRFGLQGLGLVAYSRLLLPESFGSFALILILLLFGETLRDLGISVVAARAKSIERSQVAALTLANLGAGSLFAAVIWIAGPGLVALTGGTVPEFGLRVASLVILLNAFAAQSRAMLRRELRFGRIAFIDLSANLVGVVAGLVLALTYDSYIPLLVNLIVRSACSSFQLLHAVKPVVWKPRIDDATRDLFRQAMPIMASQVVAFLARHIGSVVIGIIASSTVLGYYDRAYQLVFLSLTQLNVPATTVVIPALARLYHYQRNAYGEKVIKAQASLLAPLAFGLSVVLWNAADVVSLLLGDNWGPAIRYVQILTVAGIFQAMAYANYWVLTVEGRGSLQLIYELLARSAGLACVVAGGFRFGAPGAAVGLAVGFGSAWVAGALMLRHVDAPHDRLVANSAVLAIGSLVSGGLGRGVTDMAGVIGSVGRLACSLAVAIAVYVSISFAIPRFRALSLPVLAVLRLSLRPG